MKFISTRNSDISVDVVTAITQGLAPDGGLYIPESIPTIACEAWPETQNFNDFSKQLLGYFLKNSQLENVLGKLVDHAFNFPIPLTAINETTYLLELFHGPTLSFKDIGARFLAACFKEADQKTTIMVATSGDTGSAVASAFNGIENVKVIVLFPNNKISKRQEAQMTCWQENILPFAVEGTFDDCQRIVKSAFNDKDMQSMGRLSTANSINIARLLPQMTYYAFYALQFFRKHHIKPGVIIPSGNLGHVTACFWAKKMGFPIDEIVITTNANHTLKDYVTTGEYTARKAIVTLANAMDVGAPSNYERLHHYLPGVDDFKNVFKVVSVSDEAIKRTIKHYYQTYNRFICPHTATACFARDDLPSKPYLIVATAHPSKFETVIEPLLSVKVPVPTALSALLACAKPANRIEPSLFSLKNNLNIT